MVFAEKLKAWQKLHGRRGLPWQGTRDPYRIWLSEVMLQQTQVSAVIPYYERFLRRFPTVEALAAASEDEVLQLWSGLGYYARGRNLHAAAKTGSFPRTAADIEALPGIGKSTAAAIAAFAFGERAAILDGNVKRVLARYFGIEGWPGEKAVEAALWERANRLLPKADIETYTQALMDLGATVCTRNAPRCDACPVRTSCKARKADRTAEIPAPRPRKALPQKAVTWLVLLDRGQLLRRESGAGCGHSPKRLRKTSMVTAVARWVAKCDQRRPWKRSNTALLTSVCGFIRCCARWRARRMSNPRDRSGLTLKTSRTLPCLLRLGLSLAD
jgi:A/G-specific adenine glycosylase